MSKPYKRKLSVYQGATFREAVTWKVRATEDAEALPVDLTGATARMQIRAQQGAADALVTLTTESYSPTTGGILLGGAAGTITIFIPDSETAEYAFTAGVYDLEIELANGDVRRLMEGTVTVSREVTRV